MKFKEFNYLGGNISSLRNKQGLSQMQLAGKAGVTPASLCRFEKSVLVPSLPALGRIAKALNVSIAEILTEKGITC
jgi:transcriptional regulator with XRE-family HTH domain